MTSNPLAWLNTAAEACGYNWVTDRPVGGFRPSEEATAALKKKIEEEKTRQAQWDANFDYEVGDHETPELKIAEAFRKKLAHEGSDLIYLNGVLRRYDPARGFYVPWAVSEMQGEIGDLLAKFFTMKKVGKEWFRQHKFASTTKRKQCFDWLGPQHYVDGENFRSAPAIAFRNCTLVKTANGWEPQEHSKKHRLTHGVDHDYVPNAECPPLFKEFIRTSFGLDMLDVWRGLMNYHANPTYHCRIFLFILGQSGSGKGVALRLIQKMFPDVSGQQPQQLQPDRQPRELAQQVAKSYLITFPDLQGKQDSPGALYPLADYGQVLSGRDLFSKEPLRFIFRGRVTIASTQIPNLRDANTGFKRRVLPIKTLEKPLPSDLIPSDDQMADIWEDQLAAELGAIISWAMAMPEAEVAQILAKKHPALEEAARDVARNIDTLHSFADQCLVPTTDEVKPDINDLYSAYCCFLEVQGQRNPLAFPQFKTRLKQIIPHLHRDRSGGGKSKNRVPAHFFGFNLAKGLWGRTGEYEYRGDSVTTNKGQHGYLLRSLLDEGQLEILEDHDPASFIPMTSQMPQLTSAESTASSILWLSNESDATSTKP